jgi:hypothetical protein
MKALITTVAIALLASGCGTHLDQTHVDFKAASEPCTPADGACAAPDPDRAKNGTVPAITVGRPLRFQVTDRKTVEQEITVTRIKVAHSIKYPHEHYKARPQRGNLYVCVAMTIRNVGTAPGDLYSDARWYGKNGEVVDIPLTVGAGCDPFGMGADINTLANPRQGESVTGSVLYQVPTGVGAIEVIERYDRPLYRIDYQPGSESVRIDATT